jgi:hypothetical protein
MARTPIAFSAYGWRPKAKPSGPSVPYVIERLRRMLTSDEQRRWRAGAWPSPVTVASVTGSAMPPSTPVPMPKNPPRLTDDQLVAVLRAAESLAIGDRDAFLQDVAAALQGRELGDGTVYRAIAQVQRLYYDPPILGHEPRWGR